MSKTDKTDKPQKAQTDVNADADQILDAEIVEDAIDETPDPDAAIDELTEKDAPVVEADSDVTSDDDEDVDAEDTGNDATGEGDLAEVVDEAPSHDPVQPTPLPEKTTKRAGFAPIFFGGLVGAVVGFGAVSYLGSQGILFGGTSTEALTTLTQQVTAQDALIKRLQSEQSKISGSVNAALEQIAQTDVVVTRLAELEAQTEAVLGEFGALDSRITQAEKRPMTEGASSSAIAAYEREVEELRTMVADQLAQAEGLKQNAQLNAQQALGRAALTRILSAIDTGRPYRAALTDLASATGLSIPAALEARADTGVPTMLVLIDTYPDYARDALADARAQEEKEKGTGRLGQFLKTQLGARSTTPRSGNDADAILSRAEAALREGRLADALIEIQSLPDTSQAVMADWHAQATIRLEATQAAESLAQSLNSN
ncbi:hypothetical protein FAP39_15405 [Shimia litoralis]|uniref:Mitochondrial inner membrane protein n=1 Tax=Shimia litoralis TaxID=420403 RepID=A0A4U7MVG9_9RHOB|nr:mitofilin family membrane protein [Shimia litoralis]TKZ17105.1 hypothetical protein FAP39_15405 [Shimia litoralis]